jgi:hypothetical protein
VNRSEKDRDFVSNKEPADKTPSSHVFLWDREVKENLADKARGATLAPACAKREDVSGSGDVFPLFMYLEQNL